MSRRIHPLPCFVLLFVGLVGWGDGGLLKGSGRVKSEPRTVTGFTRVSLDGIGDLTIAQTGTESLVVEAEDNLLPRLTSSVSGGRLTLGVEGAISSTKPIHYRLGVKDLTEIESAGAGDVTAGELRSGELTLRLKGSGNVSVKQLRASSVSVETSGAGDVIAKQIAANTVTVRTSGSGDVTLGGNARSEDIAIPGAGDYDGAALQSATAKVRLTATGDAVVNATDSLRADVSGDGDVAYLGTPKVTQDVSGQGSVHRR